MTSSGYPPYQPRPQLPTDYVALAIVCHNGRVLVCRRKRDRFLGGFWEFPGGKREPLESYARCAEREAREETNLEVRALRELAPVRFDYEQRRVVLQPYLCSVVSGEAEPLDCDEVRWVSPDELLSLDMPEANVAIVAGIVYGDYLQVAPPA